ncbi:MAG: SCO family protein [Deltaproteobacteria bacterium]|nr:SCO family protein [Deltaproteobacteria bacterium]
MTPSAGTIAPRARGRTVVLVVVAITILIAIPAIAWPLWVAQHRTPDLPDYGVVPAFAFTDQTGAPFTNAAIDGKVVIANFIFTRCDTVCPVSTLKMARIQDDTPEVADDLKLVSFSVDPVYDTPPRLAEYATRFRADAARWRFVTGEHEALRKIVEDALFITMDQVGVQDSGQPNIVHQPHFILIDRQRHIRGFYDSTDPIRLETLRRDARELVRTTKPGPGPAPAP